MIKPLRVMVVEDERIIALATCSMLKKLGHEVTACVHSGEMAVQAIEALVAGVERAEALPRAGDFPDLILMDIMLEGGLDGIDTVLRIHSLCKIPVVYVTALSDEETTRRIGQTDHCGVMAKPIDGRELGVVLGRLVGPGA